MNSRLWVALAATVAATVLVATGDSDEIEPVVRGGGERQTSQRSADAGKAGSGAARTKAPHADKDSRRQDMLREALNDWWQQRQPMGIDTGRSHRAVHSSADLLAWASQKPPPPPPPPPYVPPPPPPPQAPPFAHAWVGRYLDTAERAVIAGSAQTWVVKVGDVIDSQWRVDAIGERHMTLTYLPLNQTQTVSMK